MDRSPMHYSDYLQLDKILSAQDPETAKGGETAHDEMLFIIIHQTYELWFKQLLYEVDSVRRIMKKPSLNDNSPELQTVVHRLSRMVRILRVLVQQIDIMESMEPMDFLDFRDRLRPASGFQSWQFKLLEARLGLKFADRHGQAYYISQLRPAQAERVREAEKDESLLELVNRWLERMPFFEEPQNWPSFRQSPEAPGGDLTHPFWQEYRHRYQLSLAEAERANLEAFEGVFLVPARPGEAGGEKETPGRALSGPACRAALFIMLYRGYPVLQLPYQLLNQLLEIDVQLSTWRFRHMAMVNRTIGTRIGTGGSSGADYLKGALDKHYIFREIARLNSFLLERSRLPALGREMEIRLGFLPRENQ
jgi:tryptophan 2,3-dioxygenase